MIIQSNPVDKQHSQKRYVIKLDEHLELVEQLAQSFGNDTFSKPQPLKEFLYVCRWHDKGWQDFDENPLLDSATGLPYNLIETPLPILLSTSARSPEHNEAIHPYCGLLDSMHVWGLYNGRFGMSDKVLIDSIPKEYQVLANLVMDNERQRQVRLIEKLSKDPETAPWVEESSLFANYKALQFFDTLALYFNCTHYSDRKTTIFENVPVSSHKDVEVTVIPVADNIYKVKPFPFLKSGFHASFKGRFLCPISNKEKIDTRKIMRDTPVEREEFTLIA